MVEDDRYCIDILHQIQAVKSVLAKVESQVLKEHAAYCVAEAIASGKPKEARRVSPSFAAGIAPCGAGVWKDPELKSRPTFS